MGNAIAKYDRIAAVQGHGLAEVEHRAPVVDLTFFQTASKGMPFTAALVMPQICDGELGLDDPVSKHLPSTPEPRREITVRPVPTPASGFDTTDGRVDLRKDYTEHRSARPHRPGPAR